MVYTPSFASREELAFALESGAYLNLGSISELEELVENFEPTEISLRVSPGISAGENDKIKTGGDDSKFGIEKEKLPLAKELAEKRGFKITSLHMHIGSGFYDPDTFAEAVRVLTILARDFEDLKILDLGGGFGMQYKPKDKEIDIEAFVSSAEPFVKDLESCTGSPTLRLLAYNVSSKIPQRTNKSKRFMGSLCVVPKKPVVEFFLKSFYINRK